MRGIAYIIFILLVISSVRAISQTTFHADPRLSVLVKRAHSSGTGSASSPAKKKIAKTVQKTIVVQEGQSNAIAAQPESKNKVLAYAATASKPEPTASSKPLPYVAPPVKADAEVKPLPGENGHAAGWTPLPHRKGRVIYSGKGFRVQIYNGPDRDKAILVKTEFMRLYPGVRTYLTYMSPSFRVKVGDYRNRSDAAGMLREANSMYSPSMIVPDIVTISTF